MKVIVIGGGPFGLLSSISIKKHHPNWDVLLLEKEKDIGSRIKVSGNGRCNFINKNLCEHKYSSLFVKEFLKYQTEVLNLFEEEGFLYYFDEEGRGYPTSESSLTFISLLKDLLNKYKVDIKTSYQVNNIEKRDQEYLVNNELRCDRLVIGIGGISYQNERLNYNRIISSLNVNVTKLTPSLTPLSVSNFPRELENKRVKCEVSLLYKNSILKKEKGEVLFKKDGLSGIVIFNMSSYLARLHLEKFDSYQISLNLLPNVSDQKLKELISKDPSLKHIFIDSLADYILTFNDIGKTIRDMRFDIRGIYDFKNSQVTSGGIDLKDISPSLNLKNDSNIYVGGEMIDIDGECGGYNIGYCLLAGYSIGKVIR